MTRKQQNPTTSGDRARHRPERSTASHQQNQPDNSIWDACREVQDTTALRKAEYAQRLKSAAIKLNANFEPGDNGEWFTNCPACG